MCDGSPDCADKSDENATSCGSFKNANDLVQFVSSTNASFLPNGGSQKCPGDDCIILHFDRAGEQPGIF
jgi:hypothetical protein